MSSKAALIIMDGWGKEVDRSRSAIANANTPNINQFYEKYPNSELLTHGHAVGLPEQQMGNSEVGHITIGAGRVVWQELMRINKAIENNELQSNPTFQQVLTYCKEEKKPLHLMGLVSDGGVHSHIDHLIALCQCAIEEGLNNIYIHAFTDGRDTGPREGIQYINRLEDVFSNTPVSIATVIGRYYAMDRDKRWERIKLAYDALVYGKADAFGLASEAVNASYQEDITDEFIKPKVIDGFSGIKNGDAVLCFNFRTDRCREITTVLTQESMPQYEMHTLDIQYCTMTRYDETYRSIPVLFENTPVQTTLGEVIEQHGKTQCRIAETEKYPHVTFFFSGGREKPFSKEIRKVIPSPKVATYDLQPEMSAKKVLTAAIDMIEADQPDFICLNFANPDMVGHTGVFSAAIKACETIDYCVGSLIDVLLKQNYSVLITADHGNADIMVNEDGSPHTSHTKNKVPLFYVSGNKNEVTLSDGQLSDIAPTILHIMNIPIPDLMTGKILIQ